MPKSILKKKIKSSKKPRKSKGRSKKKVVFSSKPAQVKYMSPGSKRYANNVPDGENYIKWQAELKKSQTTDYMSLFPNQEKAKKAQKLARIKREEEEKKRYKRAMEKAKDPFKLRAMMNKSNNETNSENNNWN